MANFFLKIITKPTQFVVVPKKAFSKSENAFFLDEYVVLREG